MSTAVRFLSVLFLCPLALSLKAQPLVSADSLMAHVYYLASDSLQGRRTGAPGNEAARAYIRNRFDAYGLKTFESGREAPFKFFNRWMQKTFEGVNVVGYVEGDTFPAQYIVISAHYDHVGVRDGAVYNGADDNASGSGALLELARYFKNHPARHSLIFAAFDAEELGLQGAAHFVDEPPVPLEQIVLNLNMDMVGRNKGHELYLCGPGHYPHLKPTLQALGGKQEGIKVSFGHETPEPGPADDWTSASDHGRFHAVGIPFVYFGVEDHPDYHQPGDDAEKIMPDFYLKAADFIRQSIIALDGLQLGTERE